MPVQQIATKYSVCDAQFSPENTHRQSSKATYDNASVLTRRVIYHCNLQVDLGFVKILQLCMSVVSTCQVIFMITRAPRVPWEAIYLPGTEAITYGLVISIFEKVTTCATNPK